MERYGRAAQRGALASLPRRGPRDYHTDLLPTYLLRPGKGIRPVLCLASCELHGGRVDDALPIAVALELLHSAFLIHDDVADESPTRRGRPTMHVGHGTGLAINVGDALATIAARYLRSNLGHLDRPAASRILLAFDEMTETTIEGQSLDVGWRHHNRFDVGVGDYLEMVTCKTSWYTTIQPLRMGAMAADRTPVDHGALLRFGSSLGTLFQLVNDVNGLADRDGGQTACEDLLEGKRTLALLHLHDALDRPARKRLYSIFSGNRSSRLDEDVRWVRRQMDEHGSVAYVRSCVTSMAAVAERDAHDAFAHLPESPARTLMLGIASYVAVPLH